MERTRQAGTPSPARAILAAGLLCGVMDITAAFLIWIPKGVLPLQLLQAIASGLLGPSSFQQGWATGALGLAFHFLIAFTAATVFYAGSRRLPVLTQRPWVSGVGYAFVVYGFMYWIVIPLSRMHRGRVTLSSSLIGIVTHIVCVGLPISLMVHRFSRA